MAAEHTRAPAQAHDGATVESRELLIGDMLRREYRKLLDLYFGPDFAIDEELELGSCASRTSTAHSTSTSTRRI